MKNEQLIAVAYPGGVDAFDAYVSAAVARGDSYRTVADFVGSQMNGVGVRVSHEWLRHRHPRVAA